MYSVPFFGQKCEEKADGDYFILQGRLSNNPSVVENDMLSPYWVTEENMSNDHENENKCTWQLRLNFSLNNDNTSIDNY